jgi:Arm DNA-binding domain
MAKAYMYSIKINGAKWWRFDYTIERKRKTLSLGVYPKTGLADARNKAEAARNQISNGTDPSDTRKQTKADRELAAENTKRLDAGLPLLNSFEHVTRDWLAHKVRPITHAKKVRRFELHTFPCIGGMTINAIKSPDIYNTLKPIIAQNELETAHRVHSEISCAFNYAIAHGFTDYNPAQAVAAQIPAQKVKHRAAVTGPNDIAQLLRDIYSYNGTFVVQCAFKFSPLVFQRPGEIRQMEWKDVDLTAKEWRYFVTKTEVQHIVPLSKQALAVLEDIKPLTGAGDVMCSRQAVAMDAQCPTTP